MYSALIGLFISPPFFLKEKERKKMSTPTSAQLLSKFMRSAPPIGKGKRFLVCCNGNPFAGFDVLVDAEAARAMYQKEMKAGKGFSHCCQQKWTIRENG